jgi:DNA-nicking Smr family endonuclease
MRRRSPTAAEKALWLAATRDVQPLRTPDPERIEPPAPPPLSPPAVIDPPSAQPVQPKARRPGPVDRATLERLGRGKIAIEARIDLHGMDQRQAFTALMGFIDTSLRAGRRAILIITGKGAGGQGGGVLRRNAPAWLTSSPFAARILTIVPAHARHGGDGAFYVVLRRSRAPAER